MFQRKKLVKIVKENPLHHLPDNCFLSPAKVNLFFRVLKKRGDGYHEIATKMQAISLFDTLVLKESASDIFTCSDSSLSSHEQNLVIKARNLFRLLSNITRPVSMHLEKNIPIQAGLGGGSSNAATTLYALNTLFGKPLSLETLQKESAILGADVPFFFSHGTAYCTGIGEKIENLSFAEKEGVIVKPKWGISTAGIYAHCLPNGCSQENPRSLLQQNKCINDLELPVFSQYPMLKELKRKLRAIGFSSVVLTGSGSSFLCYGENKIQLDDDLEIFPIKHIQRKSDQWYACI